MKNDDEPQLSIHERRANRRLRKYGTAPSKPKPLGSELPQNRRKSDHSPVVGPRDDSPVRERELSPPITSRVKHEDPMKPRSSPKPGGHAHASLELTVNIIRGEGLAACDYNFFGRETSSDPYVMVFLISEAEEIFIGQTKHVLATLNPKWNATFSKVLPPGTILNDEFTLQLKLMDFDVLGQNDCMGVVTIPMIMETKSRGKLWYDIPPDSAPKAQGRIELAVETKLLYTMDSFLKGKKTHNDSKPGENELTSMPPMPSLHRTSSSEVHSILGVGTSAASRLLDAGMAVGNATLGAGKAVGSTALGATMAVGSATVAVGSATLGAGKALGGAAFTRESSKHERRASLTDESGIPPPPNFQRATSASHAASAIFGVGTSAASKLLDVGMVVGSATLGAGKVVGSTALGASMAVGSATLGAGSAVVSAAATTTALLGLTKHEEDEEGEEEEDICKEDEALELQLTLHQGVDLVAKDANFMGRKVSSDPYATVVVWPKGVPPEGTPAGAAPIVIGRSPTISKNLNPVWNFTFDSVLIPVDQLDMDEAVLRVRIMDDDFGFGLDDPMGFVDIHLQPTKHLDIKEKWYAISATSATRASGRLQLSWQTKKTIQRTAIEKVKKPVVEEIEKETSDHDEDEMAAAVPARFTMDEDPSVRERSRRSRGGDAGKSWTRRTHSVPSKIENKPRGPTRRRKEGADTEGAKKERVRGTKDDTKPRTGRITSSPSNTSPRRVTSSPTNTSSRDEGKKTIRRTISDVHTTGAEGSKKKASSMKRAVSHNEFGKVRPKAGREGEQKKVASRSSSSKCLSDKDGIRRTRPKEGKDGERKKKLSPSSSRTSRVSPTKTKALEGSGDSTSSRRNADLPRGSGEETKRVSRSGQSAVRSKEGMDDSSSRRHYGIPHGSTSSRRAESGGGEEQKRSSKGSRRDPMDGSSSRVHKSSRGSSRKRESEAKSSRESGRPSKGGSEGKRSSESKIPAKRESEGKPSSLPSKSKSEARRTSRDGASKRDSNSPNLASRDADSF